VRNAADLTYRSSKRTSAPLDALMQRIVRPATWPQWQAEIVAMEGPEVVTTGDIVHGTAKLLGFHVVGNSVLVSVEEGSLTEDVLVGVRMKIHYEVSDEGSERVVTRRIDATLPEGLAGRVLSFFLKRRLVRMQERLLDDLVGQAEAGSSV
jgi:hypothetical protein